MTIDRLERQLPEILTELALPQVPDYTDDLLGRTARARQRPGWTYLERWIPMDITAPPVLAGRVPWRTAGLLLLLTLVLTAVVAVVATRQRPVAPFFGPAANGSIVYELAGDIYLADSDGQHPRVLIGGQTNDHSARFSHDGSTIFFGRATPAGTAVMRADADGRNLRQVSRTLLPGTEAAEVSPDETELAVILPDAEPPALGLMSLTDDREIRTLPLDNIRPTGFVGWRPPAGDELVFLGNPNGTISELGLYAIRRDGTDLHKIALQHGEDIGRQLSFGGLVLSDDGTTAAYSNWEPNVRPRKACFIHLVDLTTGADRRMEYDPSAQCEMAPFFMADGRLLINRQTGGPEGPWRLLVAPLDSGATGRTVGPEYANSEISARGGMPPWTLSPDRTKVLFVWTSGQTQMLSIDTSAIEDLDLRVSGDWSWQRLAPPDA